MPRLARRVARGSTSVTVIALAYAGGVATGVIGSGDVPAQREPEPTRVIDEAADRIARHASQPVSRGELERAAVTGMLRTIDDPWSRYYTPAEYHDFRSELDGFGDEAVSVRQAGEDVTLVAVSEFTDGVARHVWSAATGDPQRHAEGVILDLRGNPGGLVDEAVATASAFLRGGPVVSYVRRGEPARRLNAVGRGNTTVPLVVLVDGQTASAAEIVAGALRDRNRAVIVGSRTYGKGSVQEARRLPDGSALELTVGRYLTPGGRDIEGVGIKPDVPVSRDRPRQFAEQRALDVLTALRASLPSTAGATGERG